MRQAGNVEVGHVIVFTACGTKAFFEVIKIVDQDRVIVEVTDLYNNNLHFDLIFANCREATWWETKVYRFKKTFHLK